MLTNQVQGIRTGYAAGGTRTLKAAVKVRYASLQRILKFHLFQVLHWTYAGKLSCLSFLLVSYELQPAEIQSLCSFPDYAVSLWHPHEHQHDFSGEPPSSAGKSTSTGGHSTTFELQQCFPDAQQSQGPGIRHCLFHQ